MTPDEVSLINLVASLVLVLVTAVYVILTFLMLQQSKKTNDQMQNNAEKQMNLITMPFLKCKIKRISKNNIFSFIVTNYGNQPAYDVDVFIVGVIDAERHPIEKFKSLYLSEHSDLNENDEGFYGIYDRLLFPDFPSKTQMTENIDLPIEPMTFHVYIQFRNVLNTNFSREFWFADPEKEELSLGYVNRADEFTEPSARLEIEILHPHDIKFNSDMVNLIPEDGKKILPDLNEFVDLFSHSIPCSKLKNADWQGIEGRGVFKDI
jgi:hypothetical protein